jgi:hypothetical protein
MYEIVMTSGDRAECETIAACLTAAATLAEDSGWGANVHRVFVGATETDAQAAWAKEHLRPVLVRHIVEVRP